MKRVWMILISALAIGAGYGASVSQKQQVTNLEAFTKLWGYAKHFYPGDEAQDIDWDRFAVYGTRDVLSCRNNRELKAKLEALFSPIIPDLMLYAKTLEEIVKTEPDITKMKAFWQYSGYDDGRQSALFRSIRTNRPYHIPPADEIPYSWTWICPQIKEDCLRYDSLKISFQLINSDSQPDSVSFSAGYGGDIASEDFVVIDRLEKSFALKIVDSTVPALWTYFSGFKTILLESLAVDALESGVWKQVYHNDFSGDKPGSLAHNLSVNMSPMMGVLSPRVNVLVDRFQDKNVLRISEADLSQEYTLGFMDKIFQEELPWEEWLDEELVPGLRVSFPMVLACDLDHTYPVADTLKIQMLKDSFSDIDLQNRTDSAIWLAGVVKIWNTLKFFFPYFEYDICNWDMELPKALKGVMQAKDFIGYKLELAMLLSHTKDGHSYIYDKQAFQHNPGFSAIFTADKWIVGKVLNTEADIPLGSEITHLNGVTFAKLMGKFRNIYKSSNPVNTDTWLMGQYFKTYSDSIATFRLITPDKRKITRVVHLGDYSSYDLKSRAEKTTVYPDGIVYLNLFRLTDEDIDALMPELVKAKGIILDLSFYPRVSTHLLTLLLTSQDTWSSCLAKRYIRPNEELPRIGENAPVWGLMPEEPHLNAKIVALSSRLSQSYCESYLSVIKHNKLGIIVGQPSAGANGNVVTTALPGDITVNWTGLFVQNSDQSRFFGLGVNPDIIVERSLEDIVNGNDPELNKALKILRKETCDTEEAP